MAEREQGLSEPGPEDEGFDIAEGPGDPAEPAEQVTPVDQADTAPAASAPEPAAQRVQSVHPAQRAHPEQGQVETETKTDTDSGADSGALWPVPDTSGKEDLQSLQLVRVAWRWAAVSVLLFPILALWALPSAASVSQRMGANDVAGARKHAATSRALGVASIVAAVLLIVLWILMSMQLAAELESIA